MKSLPFRSYRIYLGNRYQSDQTKSIRSQSYRIYLGNRYQSDRSLFPKGNQYYAAPILLYKAVEHPKEDTPSRFEVRRSGWIKL